MNPWITHTGYAGEIKKEKVATALSAIASVVLIMYWSIMYQLIGSTTPLNQCKSTKRNSLNFKLCIKS